MSVLEIYCCGCEGNVEARLTDGLEIYPHRSDLHSLPFWRCDVCGNWVGCHHKQKRNPHRPLGNIPTPELRSLRGKVHRVLDPLWRNGKYARTQLYAIIASKLNIDSYHTANLKTAQEVEKVLSILRKL